MSLPLLFLSLKDLIQYFLYKYKNNKKINNILTTLSWVHISFQPLFVNIFMSHFSKHQSQTWITIFIASTIYALYNLTTLEELDIQNDDNCVNRHNDDYCASDTLSYMGKYHIAYRFERDANTVITDWLYVLLTFVPGILLSGSMGTLWAIFATSLFIIFKDVGAGEKAAIWCFLSIIYSLPVAIFVKQGLL